MTALDEIAWLLNLRGSDISYNPVFVSYFLLTEEAATLYVDSAKVGYQASPSLPQAQKSLDFRFIFLRFIDSNFATPT